MRKAPLAAGLFLLAAIACAQDKRYVIIDRDAAGPGGTDMMSILVLLQSPAVEPLWEQQFGKVSYQGALSPLTGRPSSAPPWMSL
jgi:hypothetical protein